MNKESKKLLSPKAGYNQHTVLCPSKFKVRSAMAATNSKIAVLSVACGNLHNQNAT